jgi:hypothetical protein
VLVQRHVGLCELVHGCVDYVRPSLCLVRLGFGVLVVAHEESLVLGLREWGQGLVLHRLGA